MTAISWHAVFLLLLWSSVAAAAVFLWLVFSEYFDERRKTLDAMQRFGERFVREFERPLLQSSGEARAVRARLRASPDRRRLDILLAPAGRRRYPNLVDHRQNLTYDIERVMTLLRDRSFVSAVPYEQGTWVVVPFQFQGFPNQAGGA